MRDQEKSAALTGAAAGLFSAFVHIAGGYLLSVRALGMIADSDALHTEGVKTVNARGETVALRGAGRLAEPLEISGQHCGTQKARRAAKPGEKPWIPEKVLDTIKEIGVNCVRLPFHYPVQAGDKTAPEGNGAFAACLDRLERTVEQCARRGIYAIVALDLAQVNQSGSTDNENNGSAGWLDCTLDGLRLRNRIIEIWRQAACRFAGNPAVAAFDLVGGAAAGAMAGRSGKERLLWCFYNRLYRAVRAVDPNRIIMLETAWNTQNLPDPEQYRWENVMYRLHGRNLSDTQAEAFIGGLGSRAALRVPALVDIRPGSGIRDDLLYACSGLGFGWLAYDSTGVEPADGEKQSADCPAENSFDANEALFDTLRRLLQAERYRPSENPEPPWSPAPESPEESPDTAQRDREAIAPLLALGVFTIAGSTAAGIILKHRQKVLKPKTRK
mgnify:FL=1